MNVQVINSSIFVNGHAIVTYRGRGSEINALSAADHLKYNWNCCTCSLCKAAKKV